MLRLIAYLGQRFVMAIRGTGRTKEEKELLKQARRDKQ